MDMSKAALPPRYGKATKEQEKHPLFNNYRQHCSNMSKLLVDSPDFEDWLCQYDANRQRENAAKHNKYPAFMTWMVKNQGGARKCPTGSFPHNFYYWLEGGRW